MIDECHGKISIRQYLFRMPMRVDANQLIAAGKCVCKYRIACLLH